MNGIVIQVNWEYFLGIIGALIGIAYYANGRLTRLETSVEWLTEAVRDLAVRVENGTHKLFNAGSPVALTKSGQKTLVQSGLKSYIDAREEYLLARCQGANAADRYGFQDRAFRLFSVLDFDKPFDQQLSEFAFENGMSTALLRRAGAIYLQDARTGGSRPAIPIDCDQAFRLIATTHSGRSRPACGRG
jgi:hypothetical protein